MPAMVVVGLQWGDEGKGKATDLLAAGVSYVVRYQGGDNAGHTIVLGDEVFKLHLVPSGVFDPRITPVIGNGVVVNPARLIEEMDALTARGVDVSRLRVSNAAHVILPHHLALDAALEGDRTGGELGTTNRGIGPAYADRALRGRAAHGRPGRRGRSCAPGSSAACRLANAILRGRFGQAGFEIEPLVALAAGWGERLAPYLAETTALLHAALAAGQRVLLEGAQGALLDLDQGTYPYVTSSNPVAGGASTGSGIGPRQIDRVVGRHEGLRDARRGRPLPDRAATTRPASTCASGATSSAPRPAARGAAAGSMRCPCGTPWRSTRSARSCSTSWTSCPACRRCAWRWATALDGRLVDRWPLTVAELERAEPVYEAFPGWTADLSAADSMADLPLAAVAFVEALERRAGAPITLVSVGPERTQTITRGSRPAVAA